MYILIGRSLSKSNFSGNSGQVNANYATKAKARTAVIKMLVAVVVAFFCCWAPFNAQRLMTSYIEQKDWTPLLMDIQGKLFYISGVLYFVGSTVNPILYNLMSKKFRVAFKRTLCRCCYNVEELMELSGRSVLYSDRSTCLYRNQLTTTSVMSRSPLHKSKSGSALITLRDGNTRLIAGKMVMCGNMKPTWSSPVLETKWTGSPKAARWTVSQAPDKRLTRPLKQSLQHTTSEKYLNITSSSLIKVSSTASMVSFEELEQEIYVEVNSLDGQSSTYISDRPSTDSSCKTNTTYL
ncbi:hypothetical protein FSP39_023369 [Pinctada imbricata]|uniref:G-protein coupled receptors family 1 profile domain-containing protein n=1 Tax=Pinctada imbricata TaxID=66713 RepID=A0AA89BY80_PINIB|nr:hypothetical protein FSP39_023369 [Pinctada imbricata]